MLVIGAPARRRSAGSSNSVVRDHLEQRLRQVVVACARSCPGAGRRIGATGGAAVRGRERDLPRPGRRAVRVPVARARPGTGPRTRCPTVRSTRRRRTRPRSISSLHGERRAHVRREEVLPLVAGGAHGWTARPSGRAGRRSAPSRRWLALPRASAGTGPRRAPCARGRRGPRSRPPSGCSSARPPRPTIRIGDARERLGEHRHERDRAAGAHLDDVGAERLGQGAFARGGSAGVDVVHDVALSPASTPRRRSSPRTPQGAASPQERVQRSAWRRRRPRRAPDAGRPRARATGTTWFAEPTIAGRLEAQHVDGRASPSTRSAIEPGADQSVARRPTPASSRKSSSG